VYLEPTLVRAYNRLPVRATEPSEYRQPVMTVLVQIAEQKFHRNGDSFADTGEILSLKKNRTLPATPFGISHMIADRMESQLLTLYR
jgi:hypothetical protein